MQTFSLALLLANVLAACVLFRFGHREERVIIVTAIAYVLLPPFVYQFQFATFRYGVFGLELVWMVALLWAAMKLDRWWPLLAASAQLLSCLSHLLPLLIFEVYLWSSVTVRLGLWAVVSLILLIGSWETWAHWVVTFEGEARGKRVEVRNRSPIRPTLVR